MTNARPTPPTPRTRPPRRFSTTVPEAPMGFLRTLRAMLEDASEGVPPTVRDSGPR